MDASQYDTVVFDANTLISNTAYVGGGIRLAPGDAYILTNNIIARNGGGSGGAAFISDQTRSTWIHNTIAENTQGGNGEALAVWDTGTVITLVNNIIVSHTAGIDTQGPVTVTADHTLFLGNGDDIEIDAGAIVVSTNEITGSAPMFIDPDGWDYHLQAGSPAIDAGAETSVRRDIDGDARPDNCAYDIGADEAITVGRCRSIYLPLVLR